MYKGAYEVGHGGVVFEEFWNVIPKLPILTEEENLVFKALGFSEVSINIKQLAALDIASGKL